MLPIDLNHIIMQLFQPYFYYSTTLLAVSFICIKALVKYNRPLTTRIKSLCYSFPLTIPVLLMALIPPWSITWLFFEVRVLDYNLRNTLLSTSLGPHMIMPPTVFNYVLKLPNTTLLTSMLLAVGLTLSVLYLIVTITVSDRIARRVFRIVELESGEYDPLQRRVGELSRRLGIHPPRIGLVEDLRPNAFTIGYGRRTMLVFSLGILETLKKKELAAVAAHELAHVKNNDFLFKTASFTLTLLSFFNPFAYFAFATAQKEREILADEEGARILGQPRLLVKTLVKIYEALHVFPRDGFIVRLTSGLFLSSPTSVGGMLLSTHPRLDQRVENIRRLDNGGEPAHTSLLLSTTISMLIIAAGIMGVYYLASIRNSFMMQYYPMMLFETSLDGRRFIIPAHGIDGMEGMCRFGFFESRNTSNDFNELHSGIMVLKIVESS